MRQSRQFKSPAWEAGLGQMRQEWLASKGPQAYAAMLAHVRTLAHVQQRPAASLIAGDD